MAGVWVQNPGPRAQPVPTPPLALSPGLQTLLPPLQLCLPPPSFFLSSSSGPELHLLRPLSFPPAALRGKEVSSSILFFPILLVWALKPPPHAQHPIPASPLTSSHFQGADMVTRGQTGVARGASGPSSASNLLCDPSLHSEASGGTVFQSVFQSQLCQC